MTIESAATARKGILLAGGSGDALAPRRQSVGLNLSCAIQESPDGIPCALSIGADFIGPSAVTLILGDNIFDGNMLTHDLASASHSTVGASVFAYQVQDPERYGVVEFGSSMRALSLEGKAG